MTRLAVDLLPNLEKLERVLGHKLGITQETVCERINDRIDNQIDSFRLVVLALDVERVDWDRLAKDAAFRRPPFKTGETGKGFRDALIVESFVQLVEDSPTTPNICRLALLTGDQLMTQAVRARTATCANVKVLPSVEDLKGFINTLVSNATPEFVEAKRKLADRLFLTATRGRACTTGGTFKKRFRLTMPTNSQNSRRALVLWVIKSGPFGGPNL